MCNETERSRRMEKVVGARARDSAWRRPYGSRQPQRVADDDPHANCNTAEEARGKNTFGLASNETCQTAFLIRPKFYRFPPRVIQYTHTGARARTSLLD